MKSRKDPLLSFGVLMFCSLLFAFSPVGNLTVPFKVLLIKHSVADFEKWKPAFDAHGQARKSAGQTDLDLLRSIDKPNVVLIVEQISDEKKAREFVAQPDLKAVMEKAGVNSPPEFSFYDVIRNDDSKVGSRDRVMVTHRVKDFDVWVKAFDAEGKAVRANEGLIDRVLARSIDDPNVVHLVFAITDMSKAKAAITSEAKKKIMMSAGVEGPPLIEYFQQVK